MIHNHEKNESIETDSEVNSTVAACRQLELSGVAFLGLDFFTGV